MTKSEMRYIRQKCTKNEPITKEELMRYAWAKSFERKLNDLTIKKVILSEEIKQNAEYFKEFYKKYLISGEE